MNEYRPFKHVGWQIQTANSPAFAGRLFLCVITVIITAWQFDIAAGDDSGNSMLIDQLTDRIFQQDDELVKRFDLPLQLDTVDKVN
jgi:hypothetical protein